MEGLWWAPGVQPGSTLHPGMRQLRGSLFSRASRTVPFCVISSTSNKHVQQKLNWLRQRFQGRELPPIVISARYLLPSPSQKVARVSHVLGSQLIKPCHLLLVLDPKFSNGFKCFFFLFCWCSQSPLLREAFPACAPRGRAGSGMGRRPPPLPYSPRSDLLFPATAPRKGTEPRPPSPRARAETPRRRDLSGSP